LNGGVQTFSDVERSQYQSPADFHPPSHPSWPRRAAARTGHPVIWRGLSSSALTNQSKVRESVACVAKILGGRYALPRDAAMTNIGFEGCAVDAERLDDAVAQKNPERIQG